MHRSIRLITIAVAAAAFVPAAQARTAPIPDVGGIAAPDWVKEVPASAGIAPCRWLVPTDVPQNVADACPQDTPPRTVASASDATGITDSPYEGWIVVTDDEGLQWLVPVAYAAPASDRVVAATKTAKPSKPHGTSRNRHTKHAGERTLPSASRTFPG
jgi:hypothetical protein